MIKFLPYSITCDQALGASDNLLYMAFPVAQNMRKLHNLPLG